MVQKELIRRISSATLVKSADVKTVLDALGCELADLAPTDEIRTTALGTFWVSRQKARMARNPRTGEPVEIEPRNVVLFKAAKHVRDALNMR